MRRRLFQIPVSMIPMLALVLALTGIGLAPLAMGQNTMKSMKPIKSMDTMKTMKPMKPMSGMMGMKAVEGPKVPPDTGYSDGAARGSRGGWI